MLDHFKYKEALQAIDFKALTLEQLQKDLERAHCPFVIHPDQLATDLAQMLETLSAEKLAQLLYLIDLPEKNPHLIPSGDFFLDLAEQIIHREAFKVFLRLQFSSK